MVRKYGLAMSYALKAVGAAAKCTILLSLSTDTTILMLPDLVMGSCVIRSTLMLSHLLPGICNG